jgi:integrase
MATVRRAKSGWWQAIIRRKGFPDQSKTFEKEEDATKWARDVENKMDRGIFVDRSEAESTTLEKALGRYETEVSKKKDGYDQEKYRIKTWKVDPLAKRSMASLRGADFAKWRDERLENVEASTVQKDLAVISHLFTVARKEWGLEVINPISNIKIPSEDNSRNRRLETGEEAKIIKELTPVPGRGQTRSKLMIPLVQLAIETAARQSELLALTWADVDIDKLSIRLRGKARADGKSRTKNKDKFRDVPMSPIAKQVFEGLKGEKVVSIDKVLPVSAQVAKNAFSAAVNRANIKDLTFHDLRHEGTSRLADIYEIHELMKITGHSSTRMLARYYHPRVEDLAKKLWAAKQPSSPKLLRLIFRKRKIASNATAN